MNDNTGILIIHRDLPGTHEDEKCWCEPHIIYEDDLRMPEQIVRDMNRAEVKQ
jgi:hypothetical protein